MVSNFGESFWQQKEGGANEVEVAELGCLHDFPACPSAVDLPRYLGEWLALAQDQGRDLPERHPTTLFVFTRCCLQTSGKMSSG